MLNKNKEKETRIIDYIVPNDYKLTPVEKVNLMLWSKKDERMFSIFDYNKLLEE